MTIRTTIPNAMRRTALRGGALQLAALVLSLGLLVGCSEEADEGMRQPTLELMPFSSSYFEVKPWDTRAANLPTNYEPYGSASYAIAPKNTDIGVWMTPDNTSTLEDFIYKEGSDWKSTVTVNVGSDYYIYGFMPHTSDANASITPLNGDYANGAKITLTNYNTLTENDLSVIVGLRKGDKKGPIETITSLSTPVKLGNFAYKAGSDKDNLLFILLKHLYAGLRFSARINPGYHKVRDIYVTKVELTAEYIYKTSTVEVTLTANTTDTDPSTIVYTPNGTISNGIGKATITLYEVDRENNPADKGYALNETTPTSFIGCFAPAGLISEATPGTSSYLESYNFTLKSTYDVYDKSGNMIRKDCVAENKIDIGKMFLIYNASSIQPGNLYTINLTVEPTYLYLLSEPDLDNPRVIIE